MIKAILLTVILLYLLWLVINFVSLIYKNSKVVSSFKKLEQLLIKRYGILDSIVKSEESKKYLEELKSLPQGMKFLNRKLALNYLLTKCIKQENSGEEFPDEYKITTAQLQNFGDVYNNRADILKRAVEIFPKSFYARFLNIKTVDYYRG